MAIQHPSLFRRPNARSWLGAVSLALGLVFHLLAANAESGRAIHYRHHVFGFLLLSVVSALLVVGFGRLSWRGRHDLTVLVVGALQTILGIWVYTMFSGG